MFDWLDGFAETQPLEGGGRRDVDLKFRFGLFSVSAELKWSQFRRFKGEPLRSPAVRMHTSALAAT
jgi:hypothetical protein